MHPNNLAFFSLLFGSELFIIVTFGFIFEAKIFYQLVALSVIMTFVLGLFGVLRMRNDPLYTYREAYDHEAHRFDES